jgi:hypothetical protein
MVPPGHESMDPAAGAAPASSEDAVPSISAVADAEFCVICYEETYEFVRLRACTHAYHRACIEGWLRVRGADACCPLCAERLVSEPPTVVAR